MQHNKRRIIFLVNPISGTKDKNVLTATIERSSSEYGVWHKIFPTNAEGNYLYLKDLIAENEVTDVVICGGDGTINQVASALQGDDVNIGIIPMGSGNGLAMAARIPKNMHAALTVIFQNKATPIDSFYVNGRFSCMLCGLGFDAQVAHDFAKRKRRGLQTYVKETIRNFFIAKPYPFIIIDKEIEISSTAYFISIANGNQFGNNVRIAPRASLNDGLLDIVATKKSDESPELLRLQKSEGIWYHLDIKSPGRVAGVTIQVKWSITWIQY